MTVAFLKEVLPTHPPPGPRAPPARGGKGSTGLARLADGMKTSFQVVPQDDSGLFFTTVSQECKLQKSTPAWDTRCKLRSRHSGNGQQRAGSQVSHKENVPCHRAGRAAGGRPGAAFQCRRCASKGRSVPARTPGSRAHDGQGCAGLCQDDRSKTGPSTWAGGTQKT